VVEVEKSEVCTRRLTECQQDAAAGLYAEALAGFIRWVAPRLDQVRRGLPDQRNELRARAAGGGGHARTPGIAADLALGLRYVLDFARWCGAITPDERAAVEERARAALLQSAASQAEEIGSEDAVDVFRRLLDAAIASGRGHLAGPTGQEPPDADAWGWQAVGDRRGLTYTPRGKLLGWVDGDVLFLEPEAAFAEAQELARQQGVSLAVTPRTLRKRLKSRGLLVGCERDKTTVRKRLSGKDRAVIPLRAGGYTLEKQGEQGEQGAASHKSL
jgi:hypothetical protein